MNSILHGRNEGERVAGHASVNDDARVVVLKERQVKERLRLRSKFVIVAVLGNTNHGIPSACRVKLFADRLLVRPVALSESGVDDGDALRTVDIGRREVPSGEKGSLHGLQIMRANVGVLNFHRFVRPRDVAFHLDGIRVDVEAERDPIGDGGRLYAGNCLEFVVKLMVKLGSGFPVVAEAGKVVVIDEDVMRIEAGVELLGLADAADEKSGANEEQERHGNLHDDENARKAGFM